MVTVLVWGTAVRIELAAGAHTVQIWGDHWFNRYMGLREVPLQIEPGQQLTVQWRPAPSTIWAKGRVTVLNGLQPFAVSVVNHSPAAWHRDPVGRFALRWWSGTAWTDDVSDGDANVRKDPQGAT